MDLMAQLRACPLIASVQASEDSPVDHPETLVRLARASQQQGVRVLRLQGVENIRAIRTATGLPCIGLIKKSYSDSEVYITPTAWEVTQLLTLGCEVIALDATPRSRPNGETLPILIRQIQAGGAIAMADCDSLASVQFALETGADWISTTLSGYTEHSRSTGGPDFELIRCASKLTDRPVLAEGRITSPAEAQVALRLGARAVVVGGALNDPVKQTRSFVAAVSAPDGPLAAFDIGGTWLRFGLFSPQGELLQQNRIPLLTDPQARLDWMREMVAGHPVVRIGISTGGVVDPDTGKVIEAKPLIPGHVGTDFRRAFAVPVVALNDGLATAWAHANHPDFTGMRVATLALGTGVGVGLVSDHRISTRRGDYPRLNDLPTRDGATFEELLGGAALSTQPTPQEIDRAKDAAEQALQIVSSMFLPDKVILAGGVGLSPWLREAWRDLNEVAFSPYGPDAGLYGAAALAFWPPRI